MHFLLFSQRICPVNSLNAACCSPHLCALCWSLCWNKMCFNTTSQRPGLSASTETLDRCHDIMVPQALTYHSNTLPCSSPKQDASLHYSKPKALSESIGESLLSSSSKKETLYVTAPRCGSVGFENLSECYILYQILLLHYLFKVWKSISASE